MVTPTTANNMEPSIPIKGFILTKDNLPKQN